MVKDSNPDPLVNYTLPKKSVLILVTYKITDLQTTDIHTQLGKAPMESCNTEGLKITA